MQATRPPAVAGMFYPDDPRALGADVAALLEAAGPADGAPPLALIVPHAGYVYSGAVAARGYAELVPTRGRVTRAVVLGPAHRVPLHGLGTSAAAAFLTPLGHVTVDRDAVNALEAMPGVACSDRAHAAEHSLEVQLPFLQTVLGEFKVVPLVVGEADAQTVRNVLEVFWGQPDTVVVISTDLSHYLDYATARAIDGDTDRCIRGFDYAAIGPERACGCRALAGALLLARERGNGIRLLMMCNSGDTAGSRDRVVGYAAYAIN